MDRAIQHWKSCRVSLDVFWHQPVPTPVPDALTNRLDDDIDIVVGSEAPQPAHYEVLIGVSPPREVLIASERLHTFLITQAGFTAAARAAVSGLDLAVHNLHHNSTACAETAAALMLACAKFTCVADRDLRVGKWTTRYAATPQLVLRGRTAVLLGYGAIGSTLAPVCAALGMDVIGVKRTISGDRANGPLRRALPEDDRQRPGGVRIVTSGQLDDVLPLADVLVMALPATEETDALIGARELDLLPAGAIVVNVGRAGQIDEVALHERLVSGRVAGAGIDVWPIEPRIEEHDLVTMPSVLAFHELDNVVLSPHKAGWLAHDDESRSIELASMLNALLRGEDLPNRVDVSAGY